MIVALDGGIGNQMFQAAFGLSLGMARNEEVFFTKNFTVRPSHLPQRHYMLDVFNVNLKFTDSLKEPIIDDYAFCYNPFVINAPKGASFNGWWQCEKYFNEPVVRLSFTLRERISDHSLHIADQIGERSCFLHVRRTDYATPEGLAWHGVLSMDYYLRAIERIQREGAYIKFFVFSDDPAWARRYFPDLTVVEGNLDRPWEDIWLMSLCHHAIIANSTFSWWGAWLGEIHKKRVVIGPSKWFVTTLNSKDILPDRWLKLDD